MKNQIFFIEILKFKKTMKIGGYSINYVHYINYNYYLLRVKIVFRTIYGCLIFYKLQLKQYTLFIT